MEISVLYIGDIVGKPGRKAVAELLPQLQKEFQPDLILANGENATHGHGMNPDHYTYLKSLGINAFSMGDHIWEQPDLLEILDKKETQIVRPANFPKGVPGKRFLDITVKGKRVRLINLLGRIFMRAQVDNPFLVVDDLLKETPKPDITIIDFHAEATSEKRMLAEYVDGRAQLVVGTHTHVPTADAQILAKGTAFISDLGMVGPRDSSLGAEKSEVLKNFLTGLPWSYSLGEGECELGAVFCTIDVTQKVATSITHIRRFTQSVK